MNKRTVHQSKDEQRPTREQSYNIPLPSIGGLMPSPKMADFKENDDAIYQPVDTSKMADCNMNDDALFD